MSNYINPLVIIIQKYFVELPCCSPHFHENGYLIEDAYIF